METLVVRLWVPAGGPVGELLPLRGLVEHVGSGSSSVFVGDQELLALMRRAIAETAGEVVSAGAAARARQGDREVSAGS